MYFRHHKNIRGNGWRADINFSCQIFILRQSCLYLGRFVRTQGRVTEENLFFHRVRRFYDCCLECIRFGIHGYHCQKSHAHRNIKIKCIDCVKFPYAEVFKLEHLLFAAEIFLNPPYADILKMPTKILLNSHA